MRQFPPKIFAPNTSIFLEMALGSPRKSKRSQCEPTSLQTIEKIVIFNQTDNITLYQNFQSPLDQKSGINFMQLPPGYLEKTKVVKDSTLLIRRYPEHLNNHFLTPLPIPVEIPKPKQIDEK
jgi:hypothetical protein